MTARNFAFTDYVLDPRFWIAFAAHFPKSYIIYGREVCPKTKNIHFQGYIHFKNPVRFEPLLKELKPRHLEKCKGTPSQNITYCSKDDDIVELNPENKPVGQGTRNDLVAIRDAVKNGASELDICEEFPGDYIRYHKGIEKMRNLYQYTKRNWKMDVRIYWGAPGTGKSRTVHEDYGDEVYVKMYGKWWDGYNGEKVVLIDDFDPTNCFDSTFDWYLKLLDRYPMKVEYKGGSCEFCSKIIIFTSNYDPSGWFLKKENRDAFFRRVTHIEEFE